MNHYPSWLCPVCRYTNSTGKNICDRCGFFVGNLPSLEEKTEEGQVKVIEGRVMGLGSSDVRVNREYIQAILKQYQGKRIRITIEEIL